MATGAVEVVAPTAPEISALDSHLQSLTSPSDSLESAWRAVAWGIRQQGPYFRRHDIGKVLASQTERAIALLREAPSLEPAEFRSRVNEIGPPMTDGKPLETLQRDLRTPFFLGHWAWVMSPEPAPHDGRVAKTWLTIFHLITSSDESVRDRIGRVRIGFPAQLLRLAVRASAAAPAQGKAGSVRGDLVARFAELKGHQAALKSLLGAKLEGAEASNAKTAPWRILPSDVQAHPDLFHAVRSLGLDPLATDIPTQLDALSAAAARLELDSSARKPGRVRLVGSTFVRTYSNPNSDKDI